MAAGFRYQNVDLDGIFAPRYAGWPQASATEFKIAGYGDIAQRYAVLSAGSAAANTDFRLSTLADLATIFAAYGTTNVQVATQPSAISGTAAAGNPSGTVTSNTTTCAATKGGGSYTCVWHIANGSGFSLTSPNSFTTAITGNVPAGQSVSGQIYATLSDGVTSTNTILANCSLHNTSVAEPYFTITAAQFKNGSGQSSNFYGFATSAVQTYYGGTLNSVGGFYNSATLVEIWDNDQTTSCIFGVGGLTSDPGQASLGSVTINGVTLTGASATGYLYNTNGHSQWTWSGSHFGFVAGTAYSGSIVRNGSSW